LTAAEPIRHAATAFLRGDVSVVDFTYAFRAAMNEVEKERPPHRLAVDLFYKLEAWEETPPADRPAIVTKLREVAAKVIAP
jgi:hypothetical protein